jgi:hypothetical protein
VFRFKVRFVVPGSRFEVRGAGSTCDVPAFENIELRTSNIEPNVNTNSEERTRKRERRLFAQA